MLKVGLLARSGKVCVGAVKSEVNPTGPMTDKSLKIYHTVSLCEAVPGISPCDSHEWIACPMCKWENVISQTRQWWEVDGHSTKHGLIKYSFL